MEPHLVFLGVVCLSATSWGSTYHVDSAGGSDSNNGTTLQTPWKTVAKVNAATLVAGDTVLFKCGGVWTESLAPTASGTGGQCDFIRRVRSRASAFVDELSGAAGGELDAGQRECVESNRNGIVHELCVVRHGMGCKADLTGERAARPGLVLRVEHALCVLEWESKCVLLERDPAEPSAGSGNAASVWADDLFVTLDLALRATVPVPHELTKLHKPKKQEES